MYNSKVPGYIGLVFCILITCLWASWGVIEMFHEGWYAPFEFLLFLVPMFFFLLLSLVAISWPKIGGWLLISLGLVFFVLINVKNFNHPGWSVGTILSWIPTTLFLCVIGMLFLLDAKARRSYKAIYLSNCNWFTRQFRYILATALPIILAIGFSIEPAVRVASRIDDGNYGERQIEGNGVSLVWAPEGPGWVNTVYGRTWNELALYGKPPIGFEGKRYGPNYDGTPESIEYASDEDFAQYNMFRYLSKDGLHLEDTVQDYWRLPTTDELVRSMMRHGKNCGGKWNGKIGNQDYKVLPDKETPLWNPKRPAIYYWTADSFDSTRAYYVTYNGVVRVADKTAYMGSRGYRAVRTSTK
ncbi:MAG TPA: hypothetical protein EYP60_07170 [bacterium (Candidatus Stahlbacteria)]|nr:hypothetical protein [Candidatus Stahlbacteria bacterium]